MNVLVTGATGFVGSHLVKRLREQGNTVIALVHNPRSGHWPKESLEGSVMVNGDIRNLEFLRETLARYEIEQVYHTAAIASVKTAWKEPYGVYDINVMGTVALLEACHLQCVGKILIMATDKIYGEGTLIDECHKLDIDNEPYASSKVCQVAAACSYAKTYGMKIILPVCCNIFGYDPYSNRIIPNTIKSCLRGIPPVVFENDETIREYVFIEDVLRAFQELMQNKKHTGFYNLPTGWVFNQKDVVLKICKYFPALKVKYQAVDLPVQIRQSSLSTVTFHDWKPKWSFDEALIETIRLFEFYKEDWMK